MKLKAFLREFFYIPKHGKVREKVMLAHITLSVVMMVGCLAVMTLSAYAYFSHSASTGYITIQSAQFDVNVGITDDVETEIPVTSNGKGNYVADLAAGTYTVTLSKEGNAATGFCIITVAGETYHTQQISDGAAVEFTLIINGGPATVSFAPHWGTSSQYKPIEENKDTDTYIVNGETIELTIPVAYSVCETPAEQNTYIPPVTTAQTEPAETEETSAEPESEPAETSADTDPPETTPIETTTAETTAPTPETETAVTTEAATSPVTAEAETSAETEPASAVPPPEETTDEPSQTADPTE